MSSAMPRTATVLDSSAPNLSDDEVSQILQEVYGIEGRISLLTSERDRNYHIHARDGRDVLLKVTNAAEPRETTRFQTDALLEIARADPSLPVPRIVPTLGGEAEHVARLPGQGESVVRLLTYLHGEPLHRTERSPAQRHNIARCLARLDIALAHAAAPTIPHELQWDIRNAPKLRPMMDALTAAAARAQAAGRVPAELSPRACAGTMLMMLERLSAIGPITVEGDGLGYAPLKAAAAHTLAAMLGATA